MDQQLINRIVEAALLASNQPLTVVQLGGLFPLDEPAPDGSIQSALEALQAESASRGIELVEVASGWRYQVQSDVHAWVARLWTERQTKYTRATLETLALIAYRQPITRGEIEQVRGVATNSNIIKALEEREWIRVVGHRDIPGRPELLGTTKGFLDYFGLKRLDELPPLSELKDFGELEPQFEFEGRQAVGGIPAGDGTGDAVDGDLAANDAETADAEGEPGDAEVAPEHDALAAEAGAGDAAVHADGTDQADRDIQREIEAETDSHDAFAEGDIPDADADDTGTAHSQTDDALADDGDSTGARHD